MPILEQSPAHHHLHGPTHQPFYSQQQQHHPHTPEINGKMQLTLILPNGVPTVLSVDANTPMMDLLVQAASLNKLNPSGYSLVVLDSNQHIIHFKANQTVGQIGSSTISLLPKEATHPQSTSKTKAQPFEITVRLQVNLPDAQKILLRVDPTLPLHEIKELVCKQKKYSNSHEYTFRLPTKLDQPILLGLSLALYKTNELTLVHQKQVETDPQYRGNQIQSFDRLYRIRSESQPPKETVQEVPTEQPTLINSKANTSRASTLRPSHTTLHAYWNDPNFDTQSQISNSSSTSKKRRAPRAPGCVSPDRQETQMTRLGQQQARFQTHSQSPPSPVRIEHHQSQESLLSEAARRKRKAPIARTATPSEKPEESAKVESAVNGNHAMARPGMEPPPPPSLSPGCPEAQPIALTITNVDDTSSSSAPDQTPKIDIKIDPVDGQRLLNLLQSQSPTSAKLVITTHSPDTTHHADQPATSSPAHDTKRTDEEKSPALSPIARSEEQSASPKENLQVAPCSSSPTEVTQVKIPVPKPPRQNITKEKKSPSSINGLLRIVNDHHERAGVNQQKEKQQRDSKENISYFRVAKSRCGKFETDGDGFVFNSVPIFDGTTQPNNKKEEQTKTNGQSSDSADQAGKPKSLPNAASRPSKGKQAYHLLKKYEKEEQEEEEKHAMMKDTHDLPINNPQEIVPGSPIQLEVTERTTHITVTVESDRKEMLTRVSPISKAQPTPSPPIVPPKPFGKTITEYRTVRRVGQGGETISTVETMNQRSTPSARPARFSTPTNQSSTSHETLMESIRRFGGSQNLGKK